MDAASARPEPIVSDWYAEMLGGTGYRSVSRRLAARGRLTRCLARAVPAIHGLLVGADGGAAPVIAVKRGERGATSLLALEALRGRRRVVLLEFIGRPAYPSRWKRWLDRLWVRGVEGPAMRRAMLAAQVLTEREAGVYAKRYRLDPGRLRFVPWASTRTADRANPGPGERVGVVSSGRAFCDWETLVAAHRGRDWQLTIVCDRGSARRLGRDAGDPTLRVLSEIARDEHDRLVERAAVYVICLDDPGVSAGQVRLMTAVELGTPVVATRGSALAGYVADGETALLVPPRDPGALRAAIESLLRDPGAGRRLAERALEAGRSRTYPDYFEAIRRLLSDACRQASAGGTSRRSEWASSSE